MNRLAFGLLPVAMLVLVSGCFTTTVRSGKPAAAQPATVLDGVSAAEFDERWHHGFVNGVAEVDGNYNLRHICPNGWSEITTKESFLNGIVSFGTGLLYTPQSVTIRCAGTTARTDTPVQAPPAAVPAPTRPADDGPATLF